MQAHTVAIVTAVSGVMATPASVRIGFATRGAPGCRYSIVTRARIPTSLLRRSADPATKDCYRCDDRTRNDECGRRPDFMETDSQKNETRGEHPVTNIERADEPRHHPTH